MTDTMPNSLLRRVAEKDELNEINSAPLFTAGVLAHARDLSRSAHESCPEDTLWEPSRESLKSGNNLDQRSNDSPERTVREPFSQYALLAGDSETLHKTPTSDARIFYNVAAPSSAFICGSQGSGKSHTLSCLLENCLISSPLLGTLPKPLTGILFHYDTFVSDTGGTPCEAAYLASNLQIKVRILCAPTNIGVMRDIYSKIDNVTVEALRLNESDLNTKRMLDLMAFVDGNRPLYMCVIERILRDMRVAQQETGAGFSYATFIGLLNGETLTPDQRRPLDQRLDTLESFLVQKRSTACGRLKKEKRTGTNWCPQAGELLIIDLSCPCVTPAMACSLFNICLSIFLEQQPPAGDDPFETQIGRFIALDEAHKYMGETAECETLTNTLLSTIRLQRHLGARVFISTQEPTISPKLLDLCSTTIVHRFTSPDWQRMLSNHLAGISRGVAVARTLHEMEKLHFGYSTGRNGEQRASEGFNGITMVTEDPIQELFAHIMKLKTGEALVFSPSSIVAWDKIVTAKGRENTVHRLLAHDVLKVVIRARITEDGGRSIMAT
ncbi:hypothetical protein F5Y15DRAFT_430534 [Xylariaceae sp. FL0016]|nr:hypothetical protein F5Y15DRAFT_430534 [Xylariaceae sp. FL0016]